MRHRVMLITLIAATLIAVATPSPAIAKTPPLHEVFINDPDVALPDIDCGTFTIRETSFEDRIDVITYFNDAGEPVRFHQHISFHGVLTNLSTGETLRDNASFTDDFDLVEGTLMESGITFHYTVPHEGLQLATTGLIVFDLETGEVLFEAGTVEVTDDLTVICPLLA